MGANAEEERGADVERSCNQRKSEDALNRPVFRGDHMHTLSLNPLRRGR